jgi:hypothetical protein
VFVLIRRFKKEIVFHCWMLNDISDCDDFGTCTVTSHSETLPLTLRLFSRVTSNFNMNTSPFLCYTTDLWSYKNSPCDTLGKSWPCYSADLWSYKNSPCDTLGKSWPCYSADLWSYKNSPCDTLGKSWPCYTTDKNGLQVSTITWSWLT